MVWMAGDPGLLFSSRALIGEPSINCFRIPNIISEIKNKKSVRCAAFVRQTDKKSEERGVKGRNGEREE